jgi:hypothetical protein
MPDDHSESVPPLPIPNRTVKRLHADDSADSRVKVGNRQAPPQHQKPHPTKVGFLRLRQKKAGCREAGTERGGAARRAIATAMPRSRRALVWAGSLPVCPAWPDLEPRRRALYLMRFSSPARTPRRSATRSRNPSAPDKHA